MNYVKLTRGEKQNSFKLNSRFLPSNKDVEETFSSCMGSSFFFFLIKVGREYLNEKIQLAGIFNFYVLICVFKLVSNLLTAVLKLHLRLSQFTGKYRRRISKVEEKIKFSRSLNIVKTEANFFPTLTLPYI